MNSTSNVKITNCEFKNQGSISPTFYTKLSHAPIPKAQKKTHSLTVYLALLGSVRVKMLVKLTPDK